jgi:hypothetical protein
VLEMTVEEGTLLEAVPALRRKLEPGRRPGYIRRSAKALPPYPAVKLNG